MRKAIQNDNDCWYSVHILIGFFVGISQQDVNLIVSWAMPTIAVLLPDKLFDPVNRVFNEFSFYALSFWLLNASGSLYSTLVL